MNRVAPIWAMRQNWTSPGLIATTGLTCPLMEMISPSVCSTCLINKNSFRKVFQNREITLEAIDDEPARHAAEYLFRDQPCACG